MGLHKRSKKWTKWKQEVAIDCRKQLAKDIANLWSSGNWSDVIFQVADDLLRAHAPILKARTPLFYKYYVQTNNEIGHPICIDNIPYEKLKDFLSQVYLSDEADDIDRYERGEWLEGKDCIHEPNFENITSSCDNSFSLTLKDFHATEAAASNLGKNLLLLLQDNLSDVTLIIGDKQLKCHKCILCARSEYFNAMLSGSWIESSNDVIQLHDIHPSAAIVLLYHIYGSVTELPSTIDLTLVASIADMYNLNGFKDVVSFTFMKDWCNFFEKVNNESIDNIPRCLEIADAFRFDSLRDLCMEWIVKNFSRVWCNKSFAKLPSEMQLEALRRIQESLTLDSVIEILRGSDYLLANIACGIKWAEIVREIATKVKENCLDFISSHFRSVIRHSSFMSLLRGMGKSDKIVKNIFDNLEKQLTPLNVCSYYKTIEALSLQTKHEEWEEMDSIILIENLHARLKKFVIGNVGRVRTSPGWNYLSLKQQEELQQGLVVFEKERIKNTEVAIGKNRAIGKRNENVSNTRHRNTVIASQNRQKLNGRASNSRGTRPRSDNNDLSHGTTSVIANSVTRNSKKTMPNFRRVNPSESGNHSVRNNKSDTIRKPYSYANQTPAAFKATSSRQQSTSRPASKSDSASWTKPVSVIPTRRVKETSKNSALCDSKSPNGAYYISKRVSRIPVRDPQVMHCVKTVVNQRKWPSSKIPRNIVLSRLISTTSDTLSTHVVFRSNSVKSSAMVSNQTDKINVPGGDIGPLNNLELTTDKVPSSKVIDDDCLEKERSNEPLLAAGSSGGPNLTKMLVKDTCSQANLNKCQVLVNGNSEVSPELPSNLNESNLEIAVQSLCTKIIAEVMADFNCSNEKST